MCIYFMWFYYFFILIHNKLILFFNNCAVIFFFIALRAKYNPNAGQTWPAGQSLTLMLLLMLSDFCVITPVRCAHLPPRQSQEEEEAGLPVGLFLMVRRSFLLRHPLLCVYVCVCFCLRSGVVGVLFPNTGSILWACCVNGGDDGRPTTANAVCVCLFGV